MVSDRMVCWVIYILTIASVLLVTTGCLALPSYYDDQYSNSADGDSTSLFQDQYSYLESGWWFGCKPGIQNTQGSLFDRWSMLMTMENRTQGTIVVAFDWQFWRSRSISEGIYSTRGMISANLKVAPRVMGGNLFIQGGIGTPVIFSLVTFQYALGVEYPSLGKKYRFIFDIRKIAVPEDNFFLSLGAEYNISRLAW